MLYVHVHVHIILYLAYVKCAQLFSFTIYLSFAWNIHVQSIYHSYGAVEICATYFSQHIA